MMQFSEGEDVSITIQQNLDRVIVSESECCIFKVHNLLRNVNEKAYEPEVIAIGPYHRGKSHLQMMEKHKLRFLKLLLQRKNDSVSTYVEAIRPLEEEARKCYAEPVDLSSNEFAAMMVLDGCFIIELFHKFNKRFGNQNDSQENIQDGTQENNQSDSQVIIQDDTQENNQSNPQENIQGDTRDNSQIDSQENIRDDPLFRMESTLISLQRDLMLFENQLPFFILIKLYEIVALPSQKALIDLAPKFFNDLFPGKGNTRNIGVDQDIKHLLDLIHRKWSSKKLKPNRDDTWNMDNINLIRCTTELAEAGIKFENIDEVSFDIQFNNGLLQIPVFTIENRTESFLRNLMAYEQYCGDTGFNIVTDYMTFFSCLIKSTKDVAKLSCHGILRNFAGNKELVYHMFSKMTKCITGPSRNFHYAEIFKRVNNHCERRRNRWMASLRRNYLHTPWGIISILAASTLLLLTLLQAIFQILSWKQA